MESLEMLQGEINDLHMVLMDMIDNEMHDTQTYKDMDARYNELIDQESKMRRSLGLCLHHDRPRGNCDLCFTSRLVKVELRQMHSYRSN